ncbi:galacturonosyltransferase [Amphibacillus marinus]|uniref:Galacturonosyltransferase n=1 Tax=Amphibacillus marinus TaxID=872970 RepID=A0A1H8N704_9BACI|nr:glycosyltransferase family 4 protein [Amphibacillus marinus]SEO25223.1 galacturonosyltransferase [Amphibacillus marinus]
MKQVVIISNHHSYTYNFRKEIIQELINQNYKVHLILPYGEKVELLKKMGCKFSDLPLDRRGMNPITDFKLVYNYYKLLKKIKPDVVLTYTVKPNIYGGIACRLLNIPIIPNITGLGTATGNKSILQVFIIGLYKLAFKKAKCVFFQNKENKAFFENKKIAIGKHKLLPGSGVNIDHFKALEYPANNEINFVFISRIMKEKGIDYFLEAAKRIKSERSNVHFHVCGFCENDYEGILQEYERKGIITYHGMISDVREILRITHCTVHPTYYPEGISNVLLESAASARPIITTDHSGCREVVEDKVSGFLIIKNDTDDLVSKMKNFLDKTNEDRMKMGHQGRIIAVKRYDRNIVVNEYIKQVTEGENSGG